MCYVRKVYVPSVCFSCGAGDGGEHGRFDAAAAKLLTADERTDLEFSLAKDPDAHPLIPGLNGVPKARWGKQGTGKRGGVRVIYFYTISAEVAFLYGFNPRTL